MKSNRMIIIKQIEDTKNNYIASFKNDFLGTTFALFFEDNIAGAVSLTHFVEMVKSKFSGVNMMLSGDKAQIKSQALLDEIVKRGGGKNDINRSC